LHPSIQLPFIVWLFLLGTLSCNKVFSSLHHKLSDFHRGGARCPAQGEYDIVGLSCDWFGLWKMKSGDPTFSKNRVSGFSHKNYKPLVAHGEL
jgi:hypothetical protein